MDIAEVSRLLENLIRVGTIHSVDHGKKRVRVQSGRIVTGWLRWLERRAGETTTWDPPTIGEQCVILSPSGVPEQGIVIFGAPSDIIDTPSHNPVEHVIKFPDGATFTYDHASSHLAISGIRTAHIEAAESITLDTPDTYCTGNVWINRALGVYGENVDGGLTTEIRGRVHVIGPELRHNDRNIGDTHTHSGIQPGGASTAEPNP